MPHEPPQPSLPHCLPAQLGWQTPHLALHWSLASVAHRPSQVTLQQNESIWQTHTSTFSSSQPAVPLATQQSPLHEPHWSDSPAQMESQELLQQKGSMAQTQSWTALSLQPGAWWARQQESVEGQAPQSCGQPVQFSPSPASHCPLPQQLPQSWEHVWQVSVPLHWPSPQTGATLQLPQPRSVTSWAHRPSQELLQQYGSLGQTHDSMFSSSQPGFPWLEQQSPLQEPHWSASPAQIESQELLQQKESMAQTQAWTAASLQPGVPWDRQHDSAAGQAPQSCGHEVQVSPYSASQAPLPQQFPQSLAQL